jgi:hypothetical protein
MIPTYYAILQYCPNPSRLEVANVGVVLVSVIPALPFVGVMAASHPEDLRRAERFFGPLDQLRVLAAIESAVAAIKRDNLHSMTFGGLHNYIHCDHFANDIILSIFRPCKIGDPSAALREFYDDLVEEKL